MTFVMNIQHMYNKRHLFARYHAGNKNLSGMFGNAWNTKNLASTWICMVPIPACNYSCQTSCRILVSVREHHPKLSYRWSFTNKPQSVWRDELCWLWVVQFFHQSPNVVLRKVSNLLKFIELSKTLEANAWHHSGWTILSSISENLVQYEGQIIPRKIPRPNDLYRSLHFSKVLRRVYFGLFRHVSISFIHPYIMCYNPLQQT